MFNVKAICLRLATALFIAISLVALSGCGGDSKQPTVTVTTAGSNEPKGQIKDLVFLVDTSESANDPAVRELYERVAKGTLSGENMAREGKWGSFTIVHFPRGPKSETIYSTPAEMKASEIGTINPEVRKACIAHVGEFTVAGKDGDGKSLPTDYEIPLRELKAICDNATRQLTVVLFTDGGDQGVSDKNFESVQKLVAELATCKKLEEFAIAGVQTKRTSNNLAKINRLFEAMGSKLTIITDSNDVEQFKVWQRGL